MPRFNGIPVEKTGGRFSGVLVEEKEPLSVPVKEKEPLSLGDMARSALQGITFGASDEIGTGLAATAAYLDENLGSLPDTDRSLGDIYRDMMDVEQGKMGKAKEQHPYATMAAELAGGLATGGAGAARGMGSQLLRGLNPYARAGAIGATEGATYGALSAKPGERIEQGAIGGITGAVASPAVLGAGRVASAVGAPVARRIRGAILGDSTSDAGQYLAAGLRREGVESLDQIRPQGRNVEMATLADMSETGRGMLEGLVSEPDARQIRKMAKDLLQDRNRQQQSRLFDVIDEDIGTVGKTFKETVDNLKRDRADVAGPLYRAARQRSLEMTPYMRAVMNPERGVPEVLDALKKAQRKVATRRATGEQISNIDIVDEMKRAMDDDVKALFRLGKNYAARDLIKVKNRILADVDEQIPEYKAARNAYSGDSELIDAAELGTQVLRKDVDYIDDILRTMTDSERGMFRVGAKKAIREKLMQARLGTNSINRIASELNLDRMKRAFPSKESFNRFRNDLDFEARIFDTERVLHNSATALRQAEQRAMRRGVPYEQPEVPRNMSELAARALNRIFDRQLSPETKLELGRLLLTPINQLDTRVTQRIERTIRESLPDAQRPLFDRMVEAAAQGATAAAVTAPAIAPSIVE